MHPPPPSPPPASLEDRLLVQIARRDRREAALGRDLSEALRRVRRVSDLVEDILANHAGYHVLVVDLADRVRRLVAPEVVHRRAVYRAAPGPIDPTKPDPLPGPPPE